MEERRNDRERRSRRRHRRHLDDATSPPGPDVWKQVRRLLIVALGLAALGAGGVAAGYGIAAMRAAGSPVQIEP